MTSETRFIGLVKGGADCGWGGRCQELTPAHPSVYQVKEMSLIRNTIMECQVCGEWESRGGLHMASVCSAPPGL